MGSLLQIPVPSKTNIMWTLQIRPSLTEKTPQVTSGSFRILHFWIRSCYYFLYVPFKPFKSLNGSLIIKTSKMQKVIVLFTLLDISWFQK